MSTKSNAQNSPVLIIVMGTSGSGKSTLGSQLAESLKIPFVDGDDLHPQSNIQKMSNGIPLSDEDRLPWLLSIREKALSISKAGEAEDAKNLPDSNQEAIRELVEKYETSHAKAESKDQILNEAEKMKKALHEKEGIDHHRTTSQLYHPACVIACSALKKSYRQLLRQGLSQTETGPEPPQNTHLHPNSLDVFHVYLKVSPEELLRRMHKRKGHFMKEDMLKSQLATLEDPEGEPKTLVLDDGPVESLVQKAKSYFEEIL